MTSQPSCTCCTTELLRNPMTSPLPPFRSVPITHSHHTSLAKRGKAVSKQAGREVGRQGRPMVNLSCIQLAPRRRGRSRRRSPASPRKSAIVHQVTLPDTVRAYSPSSSQRSERPKCDISPHTHTARGSANRPTSGARSCPPRHSNNAVCWIV